MKNTLKTLLAAGALVMGMGQASAVPITGTVSFVGSGTASELLGTTTIAPNGAFTIVGGTLDYLGVTGSATFSSISYTGTGLGASLTASVDPVWTFNYLGDTYEFALLDLDSAVTVIGPLTSTVISGTGIARITGFDDTVGNFTLNGGGVGNGNLTFTFVTTSALGQSVPDGGATAMLLGLGFIGAAALRRRIS